MKTYCQDFGGKLKGTGQRQILPARKICSGLFCASKKAARAKRCFAPLPRPTYKKTTDLWLIFIQTIRVG